LAQFLKNVEEHEELLKQRLKAIDNQAVLRVIDGGVPKALSTSSNNTPLREVQPQEALLYALPDMGEEQPLDIPKVRANLADEEFELYGEY
ncbi:MAG: hypothetical protein ACFB4J_17205, partial [Elainellaceae cyanobacterium]